MIDLQLNSSGSVGQYVLKSREVADRLCVAHSTLNSWLKEDEAREGADQQFKFHRWVGNRRRWSEEGYRLLEIAVHRESENGVLSSMQARAKSSKSAADPDAEASLAEVLEKKSRTY